MKQRISITLILLGWTFSAVAQTFTESGQTYPLGVDNKKQIVSGFVSFENLKDEEIYANALLWTIEQVCPKFREGITGVDIPAKSFSCDLVLTSGTGADQGSLYYCKAIFRVAKGKLTYYLSDIRVESSVLVIKKITPIEKLTPDKKEAHALMVDDFVKTESRLLNQMFDFVAVHPLAAITHWKEISIQKPVEGMTEDECRLAFGKPQSVMETNGEVQWMYNSSFYLFFKDGVLQTIVR